MDKKKTLQVLFDRCETKLKEMGFKKPPHRTQQHWRSRVLEYHTKKGGKINIYITETQMSVTFLPDKNNKMNKYNINGDHEIIMQCIPFIMTEINI